MLRQLSILSFCAVILLSPTQGSANKTVNQIIQDSEVEYDVYQKHPGSWRGEHPKKKAADALYKLIPTLTQIDEIDLAGRTAYTYYADIRGLINITDCSGPTKKAAERIDDLIPTLKTVSETAKAGDLAFNLFIGSRGDCSGPITKAKSRMRELLVKMKTVQELYDAHKVLETYKWNDYAVVRRLAAELMSELK